MTAEGKSWVSPGGARTGKTAIMRVSDDEKGLLEEYRRRLRLRSEAQVLRAAMDLLALMMDGVEAWGILADVAVTKITQGQPGVLGLLIEVLEEHPDWYPDEREELLGRLRSKLSGHEAVSSDSA